MGGGEQERGGTAESGRGPWFELIQLLRSALARLFLWSKIFICTDVRLHKNRKSCTLFMCGVLIVYIKLNSPARQLNTVV